jgi:glucoamylase
MLAWRMKRFGGLHDFDPYNMVMAAIAYLILNGPITQQERWEEVAGFSPSTLASNIAALTCAASFAEAAGDTETATLIQDYADYLKCHIEDWTVTTSGDLVPGISEYFVRVNPCRDVLSMLHINDATVSINNRAPWQQQVFPAKNIVDGGFLELVRYGIYPADSALIKRSLAVVDAVLKVETPNGPCWHRYNHDGYGQKADGKAFDGVGVGRAWPLLTGERAHYELAAGNDVRPLIQAMENFASRGGTLPEQIWDTDDIPEAHLHKGHTTGAAQPLAWAHAEYIKLLRSASDGRVFDIIPEVENRYIKSPQLCKMIEIWHHKWQTPVVRPNYTLRILAGERFHLVVSFDDWQTNKTIECTSSSIGVHFCDIAIGASQRTPVCFTFRWIERDAWDGSNYTVNVQQ